MIFWLLAREVMSLRGKIENVDEWDVMVDLFYCKNLEELKEQEEQDEEDEEAGDEDGDDEDQDDESKDEQEDWDED